MTAVEQVNVAIGNIAQASKETEASSGQTLQTASQLAALSKDLLRLVQAAGGLPSAWRRDRLQVLSHRGARAARPARSGRARSREGRAAPPTWWRGCCGSRTRSRARRGSSSSRRSRTARTHRRRARAVREARGRRSARAHRRCCSRCSTTSARRVALADTARARTPAPTDGGADPGVAEELFRAFRPDVHELGRAAWRRGRGARVSSRRCGRCRSVSSGRGTSPISCSTSSPLRPLPKLDVRRSVTERAKARSLAEDLRTMFGALERDLAHASSRSTASSTGARAPRSGCGWSPASTLFTLLERAARDAARRSASGWLRGTRWRRPPRTQVLSVGAGRAAADRPQRGRSRHRDRQTERDGRRETGRGPRHARRVAARHRSSFACTDDGRGIDLERCDGSGRSARACAPTRAAMPANPRSCCACCSKAASARRAGHRASPAGGSGWTSCARPPSVSAARSRCGPTRATGQPSSLSFRCRCRRFDALLVEAAGVDRRFPLDAVRGTVRIIARRRSCARRQGESILYDGQSDPARLRWHAVSLAARRRADRDACSAVVVQGERRRRGVQRRPHPRHRARRPASAPGARARRRRGRRRVAGRRRRSAAGARPRRARGGGAVGR